ncbi:hypothetical protein, partial [Abiotrophia defectiva]
SAYVIDRLSFTEAMELCQDQLASQAPYSSCYIKYGSELLPSDQVEIRSQVLPLGDQEWVTDHQIYNVSKDKVACLVQFVWNQPVDLA